MSTTQQITTEDIREALVFKAVVSIENLGKPWGHITREAAAEFDAWLRRVKAEAWQEAADEIAQQGTIQIPDNPYQQEGKTAGGA